MTATTGNVRTRQTTAKRQSNNTNPDPHRIYCAWLSVWAHPNNRCGVREDLSTLDEVAASARISVRTLYRLIATGRGPVVTEIGGKRFVREEHRIAWLDASARHDDGEAA